MQEFKAKTAQELLQIKIAPIMKKFLMNSTCTSNRKEKAGIGSTPFSLPLSTI
jgi:hypothetical protein